MSIRNILSNDCIDLDIKSTTKKEILEDMIAMLYTKGVISDKNKFYKDLCLREKEGSTAIGNYIAIPHGNSTYVTKLSISIGRTNSDVYWDDEYNFPVRFIILFAVPETEDSRDELSIMAKICRKLGNDDLCNKLLEIKNYKEVFEILS